MGKNWAFKLDRFGFKYKSYRPSLDRMKIMLCWIIIKTK